MVDEICRSMSDSVLAAEHIAHGVTVGHDLKDFGGLLVVLAVEVGVRNIAKHLGRLLDRELPLDGIKVTLRDRELPVTQEE